MYHHRMVRVVVTQCIAVCAKIGTHSFSSDYSRNAAIKHYLEGNCCAKDWAARVTLQQGDVSTCAHISLEN